MSTMQEKRLVFLYKITFIVKRLYFFGVICYYIFIQFRKTLSYFAQQDAEAEASVSNFSAENTQNILKKGGHTLLIKRGHRYDYHNLF